MNGSVSRPTNSTTVAPASPLLDNIVDDDDNDVPFYLFVHLFAHSHFSILFLFEVCVWVRFTEESKKGNAFLIHSSWPQKNIY